MEKLYHYTNGSNGIEAKGYIVDLITELQKRMKFRANITVAPANTTYDDLVDLVAKSQHDIVVADLSRTSNRLEKIDFSFSIHSNSLCMIVRKSAKRTTSLWAFLKPFHYSLWLAIFFGIYLSSAIIIAIFETFDQRNRRDVDEHHPMRLESDRLAPPTIDPSTGYVHRQIKLNTFVRSSYYTIGNLLQGDSGYKTRSISGRFQTAIVWLIGLILITLFTSNMVQYFLAEREKPWIDSIEDLRMCGTIGCDRIGVLEDSYISHFFQKELTNGKETNYHRIKFPIDSYTKLLNNEIDVAIVGCSNADYLIQTQYCDLERTGSPFGSTDYAIGIPKGWPFREHLDHTLTTLKEDGEFDRLNTQWFHQNKYGRVNGRNDHGFGAGLTLEHTRGLFIIYGCFTAINILLFIFQRVMSLMTKKREDDATGRNVGFM